MDDYQKNEKESKTWEEIGAKFTALGESLTEAVEDAWNDPKTQDVLENIKNGLQQAADEIDAVPSFHKPVYISSQKRCMSWSSTSETISCHCSGAGT